MPCATNEEPLLSAIRAAYENVPITHRDSRVSSARSSWNDRSSLDLLAAA